MSFAVQSYIIKRNAMKLHKSGIVTCLIIICSSFATADTKPIKSVDQLLNEFATNVSKLDVKQMRTIFLPPDTTPDGKNRQKHLHEMERDWSSGHKGFTVAFKNSAITIKTTMVVNRGKESESVPVEFKIVKTKDGYKIASMNFVKTDKIRSKVQSLTTANKFQQIGVACFQYAVDHNNKLPSATDQLGAYLGKTFDLSNVTLVEKNTRLQNIKDSAKTILAKTTKPLADNKHVILYVDGHCKIVDAEKPHNK